MSRAKPVWASLCLTATLTGCAADRSLPTRGPIPIAPDDAGRSPIGFTQTLTGGGPPVSWVVRADPSAPAGGPVVVQERTDDTSYRFPLCVYDGASLADVLAEVRFKTIAGAVDQAAGLVLRYQTENYYVARANAIEDNINLFKTINGNRLKIAEVDTKVTPGQWHTLGFKAVGPHLTVTFDGKQVIAADDVTFPGAGKVGLWTKADSVTAFADLRIEPARPTEAAPANDLLTRARRSGQPVVILAFDPTRSEADRAARKAFGEADAGAIPVELDLSQSHNRADAAPFHALDGPTLICLSPHGVIASRDDATITPDLLHQRIASLIEQGPKLDTDLARLTEAATAGVAQRMALADFLLAHHNDREAIPLLKRVADDASADVSLRVRAWVALGRSHLWVVEPEKARHAAQALVATLGPRSPEAVAGGNLVRGLQDTKAKRYDRARAELNAAVEAAPQSTYGQEAKSLLAKLPPGA